MLIERDSTTQEGNRAARIPGHLERGSSTAVSSMVNYRLGKLLEKRILSGVWLDCGCADGGYTVALVNRGVVHAIGMDMELERVVSAQVKNLKSSGVTYICSVSESMPFPDAIFDGVLLNEVLEHVINELSTLREINRILRPGGYLALMSPNRWFPFEGHGMRIHGISFPFPVPFLPWIPSKLAIKVMCARNYWPGELRNIVLDAGFDILAMNSLFPMFDIYPWLPAPVIRWYRYMIPVMEQTPLIRRFGNSTFVLARRPTD